MNDCPIDDLLFAIFLWSIHGGKVPTTRRLTRWTIELSDYNIDYVQTTAIKGKVVRNWLHRRAHVGWLEHSLNSGSRPWTVEVDGSSYNTSVGIGIKITTPNQRIHKHFICLRFAASNNVVEYEATIHGLKIVKMLGATMVKDRFATCSMTNK